MRGWGFALKEGMRAEILHVENGLRCNVDAAQQEARSMGLVACVHDTALEQACRLLEVPFRTIAQLPEDAVGTRIALINDSTRPQRALWLPAELVGALLSPAATIKPQAQSRLATAERVQLWVMAVQSAQGAPPEELEAAQVLLALGEGLQLLTR